MCEDMKHFVPAYWAFNSAVSKSHESACWTPGHIKHLKNIYEYNLNGGKSACLLFSRQKRINITFWTKKLCQLWKDWLNLIITGRLKGHLYSRPISKLALQEYVLMENKCFKEVHSLHNYLDLMVIFSWYHLISFDLNGILMIYVKVHWEFFVMCYCFIY